MLRFAKLRPRGIEIEASYARFFLKVQTFDKSVTIGAKVKVGFCGTGALPSK